jgi:hypothetical protein
LRYHTFKGIFWKETEILNKKKVSDLKWIAGPVTGYGHQIQIGWGGK